MEFQKLYKVLIAAASPEAQTPMRRHGAAIIRHLREDCNLEVSLVGSTADAISEIESDASVATALLEWGDETGGIDTHQVLFRMREIGLEAPVFVVVSNR